MPKTSPSMSSSPATWAAGQPELAGCPEQPAQRVAVSDVDGTGAVVVPRVLPSQNATWTGGSLPRRARTRGRSRSARWRARSLQGSWWTSTRPSRRATIPRPRRHLAGAEPAAAQGNKRVASASARTRAAAGVTSPEGEVLDHEGEHLAPDHAGQRRRGRRELGEPVAEPGLERGADSRRPPRRRWWWRPPRPGGSRR